MVEAVGSGSVLRHILAMCSGVVIITRRAIFISLHIEQLFVIILLKIILRILM